MESGEELVRVGRGDWRVLRIAFSPVGEKRNGCLVAEEVSLGE